MKRSVKQILPVLSLLSVITACSLDGPEPSRATRDLEAVLEPAPVPITRDATVDVPGDSGSPLPGADAAPACDAAITDAAIADAALACDSGLDCGPVDSDFDLCDGDAGVIADASLADPIGAADYGAACRKKRCPDDLDDSEKHLYEFCVAAVPTSALKTGCKGLVQPWKYICDKAIGETVAKACCNAVVDTEVPPVWRCTQIYEDAGTNAECTACCERMFKANGPLEDWRVRCNTRCGRIQR